MARYYAIGDTITETRTLSGEAATSADWSGPSFDTLFDADNATNATTLSPYAARLIRAVLVRVLSELRAGAHTARVTQFDGSTLTYADGWSSAVTLATIVAADAMREGLAPIE